jgi:hypothetical protein
VYQTSAAAPISIAACSTCTDRIPRARMPISPSSPDSAIPTAQVRIAQPGSSAVTEAGGGAPMV